MTSKATDPRVESTAEAFSLGDCKRCYVSGVQISGTCPNCKTRTTVDLSERPLSYPAMNEDTPFVIGCAECLNDFLVPIRITFTVALAEPQPTDQVAAEVKARDEKWLAALQNLDVALGTLSTLRKGEEPL